MEGTTMFGNMVKLSLILGLLECIIVTGIVIIPVTIIGIVSFVILFLANLFILERVCTIVFNLLGY